jgi:quercetin dioxygenase-like cupin family protein
MDIKRSGARSPEKPPTDYFHGAVRLDRLMKAPDPARVEVVHVAFAPGARTAWHTHPLGQTLYITSGRGWVQQWGGPVEEVVAGDAIWFPPGEKHWHGATSTDPMTHLAVQEVLDGKAADWLEQVSEAQYRK